MNLPNSPFTANTVSIVFAIGHIIMVVGCVISGVLLDYSGPRFCAASGLVIEAVGFLMLADMTTVSPRTIMVAYGLMGWGGCQVFLAALTFANAFERANLFNSMLTAAFNAGAFLFMVLPYVKWESFFLTYGIICLFMALVTSITYPNAPLPLLSVEGRNASDAAVNATDSEYYWKSLKSAFTPGMIWFMITFMVTGSALVYGIGEFPAAVIAKDDCIWDDERQHFKACKDQAVQSDLNSVW